MMTTAEYSWDYCPAAVLSTIGELFIIVFIDSHQARHRDLKRGWRVGHRGRDEMFYEEVVNGRRERIPIGGEMLCGKAHHVIYFPSDTQWETFPDWTRGRQAKISARIKQEFAPPGYEYQESEPANTVHNESPQA